MSPLPGHCEPNLNFTSWPFSGFIGFHVECVQIIIILQKSTRLTFHNFQHTHSYICIFMNLSLIILMFQDEYFVIDSALINSYQVARLLAFAPLPPPPYQSSSNITPPFTICTAFFGAQHKRKS